MLLKFHESGIWNWCQRWQIKYFSFIYVIGFCAGTSKSSHIWDWGGGVQFSVCTYRRRSPRISKSEKFCTRKKPVAAGALSCHANESVNWSSAVRPREQWIFLWRHSFLKTEYSVTNSLFLRKKFARKRQKTGFWGDGVATFMPTGYSCQSFLK